MLTIWKFPIPVEDQFTIDMPQGAKLLHVEAQHEAPMLWALVDPAVPVEPRRFKVFGTGHPIAEDPGAHVGTFMLHGGQLVFHLFERASGDRQAAPASRRLGADPEPAPLGGDLRPRGAHGREGGGAVSQVEDALRIAAYAGEGWLRRADRDSGFEEFVAAIEAWARVAGWTPPGETPVTVASTEEALAAWARSKRWTPPESIDVEALALAIGAGAVIPTQPGSREAARVSAVLREALSPAAKPAAGPPSTAPPAARVEPPLTREQLDLVERVVISRAASLKRPLYHGEAETEWRTAEEIIRARPAHLDPEAARRVEEMAAVPAEVGYVVTGPIGSGFVIDTRPDGETIVTVRGERYVPAKAIEKALDSLEAEGKATAHGFHDHRAGILDACARIRRALPT